MIRRILARRESYIIVLTFLLWGIISTMNRNFAMPSYLLELIGFNSVYIIGALGVLPLMIKGNFDLSIGAMITSVSFFLVVIHGYLQLPIYLILFMGLILGSLLGLMNGFFISYYKIPSVIVTLASMSLFSGMTKFMNRTWSLRGTSLQPISVPVLWIENMMIILMLIVTYSLLKYHPLGRAIYAFGGDEKLAIKKGYPLQKTTLFVHAFSGLSAGLAAVIHFITFGRPSIDAYVGIEFELIIIVIIGGLHILGGYGTVLGTFSASLFVVVLKSGLVFARIPVFWHDMVIGVIIILVVSYDMLKYHKYEKRLMRQGE
ncbi:MAG: ABC transporter permease [Vallitaleaceae bacterium]|nr:ABC transporter permease [Vallitaleaceae bacterium]